MGKIDALKDRANEVLDKSTIPLEYLIGRDVVAVLGFLFCFVCAVFSLLKLREILLYGPKLEDISMFLLSCIPWSVGFYRYWKTDDFIKSFHFWFR